MQLPLGIYTFREIVIMSSRLIEADGPVGQFLYMSCVIHWRHSLCSSIWRVSRCLGECNTGIGLRPGFFRLHNGT